MRENVEKCRVIFNSSSFLHPLARGKYSLHALIILLKKVCEAFLMLEKFINCEMSPHNSQQTKWKQSKFLCNLGYVFFAIFPRVFMFEARL